MNYKQCVIFNEVVKTNNFTKAAENLYLTQSAVSHAIKDLENEAGLPLFERLHRSVRLTSAGQVFYEDIKPLLATFEKSQRHLQHLQSEVPLRLAVSMTFAKAQLSQVIQTFKKQYPDVTLAVQICPTSRCLELLQEGQVELAIAEGPLPLLPFYQQKIGRYALVPIAAMTSPLTEVTMAEFLEQPLLLREIGSAPRATFDAYLTLNNRKVTPTWESLDTASLISGVASNLGVSILPAPLIKAALDNQEIRQLTIKDLDLSCEITALCRELPGTAPFQKLWQLLLQN